MTEMVRAETHFSSGAETPELEHYRPISPLVITACLAGLASVLAFVHPLLWIVPVVAAILSICAIVRVSAPQSRYSGRGAAVAALCIAAIIGTYVPARALSRERALYELAQSKVETWLALLQQGRVQEAHQLSLKVHDRFQGPGALDSHYVETPLSIRDSPPTSSDELEEMPMAEPSAHAKLTGFTTQPVVAKVLEFGEQSRIEHLENVGMKYDLGDLVITLRYRVSGVHEGQPESVEFLIRGTRHEGEHLATWNVDNLEMAK